MNGELDAIDGLVLFGILLIDGSPSGVFASAVCRTKAAQNMVHREDQYEETNLVLEIYNVLKFRETML